MAMRAGFAGLLAGVCGVGLLAQADSQHLAKRPPVVVQDGGVSEVLESIFIPPLTNAPFTFVLHTEWVRTMPDGGTVTLVNKRTIARERSGRFYQERWLLVPKNSNLESQMSHIQIADPTNHTLYTLTIGAKAGTLTTYGGVTTQVYKPQEPSGPLPNGEGDIKSESLGSERIQGVETEGTRITKTINAWIIGNDRPISITREFWFAPSLGINLISKLSDPRFGSQSFVVTDLVLGDPDPTLFEIPKDFKIRDARPTPPEN